MQIVSKLRSFPDHRLGQGVRYPLYSIILLVLFGFLSGHDSLSGVSRFANTLTKPQLKRLGIRRCLALEWLYFFGQFMVEKI